MLMRSGKLVTYNNKEPEKEKDCCNICLSCRGQTTMTSLQMFHVKVENIDIYRVQCECDINIHVKCIVSWFDALDKRGEWCGCPVCNKKFVKVNHIPTQEEIDAEKRRKRASVNERIEKQRLQRVQKEADERERMRIAKANRRKKLIQKIIKNIVAFVLVAIMVRFYFARVVNRIQIHK